jgi:hypothetical protein
VITDDELIRLLELADPALVADPAPVQDPADYRHALKPWIRSITLIDHQPAPTQPASGGRWPIQVAAAAAAVVLVVGVLVVGDGDDGEIEVPGAPPSTVASTTVDTASTRIDQPLACESEQCPWSPELTARALGLPIACNQAFAANDCGDLAVSPDGTLVAYDASAGTLTWYEDVPRVVSITAELARDDLLVAIGPYDIAYIASEAEQETVAVAPSGAEITRLEWPSRRVFNGVVVPIMPLSATAAGLIVTNDPGWPTVVPAPVMPWVDLKGNPITDRRPYPTATATSAGTEVRLGDREWLLAVEDGVVRDPVDFVSRSDGGVVMVLKTFGEQAQQTNLLELSPDGTIGRYFVEPAEDALPGGFRLPRAIVLPDGSLVVEHGAQLVRLTPPR